MEQIRQRRVLRDALLQVLAQSDQGLRAQDVYDRVDEQYSFPEEWYRQIPRAEGYRTLKSLGFGDWREVPQELLIRLVNTEPQWQNEIRWSRNELRKAGHLDISAPRGVWRLTAAGRNAAERLEVGDLTDAERMILTNRKNQRGRPSTSGAARTDLIQKLQTYTSSMPLEDLEMLLEIAWTVRKRSLPLDLEVA